MIATTIRVIKGAPEAHELAALVAVLHALPHPGSPASRNLAIGQRVCRRAPWTRPERWSGVRW